MSKTTEIAERVAKDTTETVMGELKDRGGFDSWWDSLDDDIQDEISGRIEELIQAKFIQFYYESI